jgi:hypothetical protein
MKELIEALTTCEAKLAAVPVKERSAFQGSALHQVTAARQNLVWHEEAQKKSEPVKEAPAKNLAH